MSTWGSIPAASACATWARPISPPSGVTKLLSAMFCALNGATRQPASASRRQNAAAIRLLPTWLAVPRTIRAGTRGASEAVTRGGSEAQDLGQGREQAIVLGRGPHGDPEVSPGRDELIGAGEQGPDLEAVEVGALADEHAAAGERLVDLDRGPGRSRSG